MKSYIHIRDVSRGELAAMEKGTNGLVYHLSPEEGIAVRDVVSKICELMGMSFCDNVEIVAERLGQDRAYVIDSTRARRVFGWSSTTDFRDGFLGVIEWIEANFSEIRSLPLEYEHQP